MVNISFESVYLYLSFYVFIYLYFFSISFISFSRNVKKFLIKTDFRKQSRLMMYMRPEGT